MHIVLKLASTALCDKEEHGCSMYFEDSGGAHHFYPECKCYKDFVDGDYTYASTMKRDQYFFQVIGNKNSNTTDTMRTIVRVYEL